jgi:hypothetical protein
MPDGNVWSAPPASPTPQDGTFGTPFGLPSQSPRAPRRTVATTGDVVAGVVTAAAMLAAGIPLGLIWGATVPMVDVNDLLRNSSETALEAQPAADARFALLAAAFGIVVGLLAGWRGRKAGWPLPVGIALGGVGGSLIAAQVGHLLASDDALAAVPPTANPLVRDLVDVTVRADGVHAIFAVAAVFVFLVIVVLTTKAEPLTVPDEPPAGAWWSAPR